MNPFPDEATKPAHRSATAWLWAFAFVAVFHILKAHANPSPIYGGDEYAYLANGLFRTALAEIWQRDPYLQRIVNPLYLALVDHAARLFPDPVAVLRAIAVLSYITMIGVAGWYVSRRAGDVHAIAMVLVGGLLPSAGYTAALMPEVMFFAAAVTAVLAVTASRGTPGAIVAGALTVVALLLKPHAMSLLLGIVISRFLLAVFLSARGHPWRPAISSLIIYLAASYAFLVASALIFFRRLHLDPRFVLGDTYGSAARTSLDTASSGFGQIAAYVLANSAAVLVIATPLIGLAALQAARALRSGVGPRESLDLPLTTLCVCAITIGMVSVFTYGIGVHIPSEAHRLHGRYYAYVYILLAISALSVPAWRTLLARPVLGREPKWLDGFRSVGIIWAMMIPFCLAVIWQFQILPWDNPELQALYRNDLATWNSPVHIRWFAIAAPVVLMLAAVAFIIAPRTAPVVTVTAIALVFAMSTLNTTRFQYFQIASSQFLTEAGRFARDLFPRGHDDKVVVVGTERYGAVAYVLFGMKCKCHVYIVDEGKPIRQEQLPPGIAYVFSVRSHPLDFPAKLVFQAPAGSFYRIGG